MAARTTSAAVQALLTAGGNYSAGVVLTPYIDAATAIVDRVAACASAKGMALSDAELELIERWMSAHAYQQDDAGYASRATEGASGSFKGQFGMGLENTSYGQMAVRLDWSGCLNSLDKRARAGGFWLGKTKSERGVT